MKHSLSEEQVTFVFNLIIITSLIIITNLIILTSLTDPAFNMNRPCTPSCQFALEDVLITCLMLCFAFCPL